jgi:hypothetical protein
MSENNQNPRIHSGSIKFLHLTAFIGLVFLSACASHPRVVVVHEPDPEQPPTHIPLQSEANVIIPGQTKAYPVARYVDPSNPRIMHERHVIYRREEDDRWRLASNARQQILIGNLESDSRQERRAAPYAQELPNLLRKNQEEAQALNQTIEEQNKQTAAVLSSIRNLGDGMQALNRRLGVVEKKLIGPGQGRPTPQPTASPSNKPPPQGSATPNPSATDVNPDGKFEQ